MVPAWFIQAKKDGLPPEELRRIIAGHCLASQKRLTGNETPPSAEWVEMQLMYYEQLLERAPA